MGHFSVETSDPPGSTLSGNQHLVVLRTIRGGDQGSFVPQLAVMLGMLMGLMSIGVLIYFIHHVPQSIHINHVAASIGRQLIDDVGTRFPKFIGEPAVEFAEPAGALAIAAVHRRFQQAPGAQVASCVTGYIQTIDDQRLMQAARDHDLVVRLLHRPGDFVHAGRVLIEAWPGERLDGEAKAALRASYTTGDMRTPVGDLDFLVGELVEIAARALSPGVNDPATARTCLDWLGAGLSEIALRHLPVPERTDVNGVIRVIAQADDFRAFVSRSFGALRQYAARDESAALHWLRTLGEVSASCIRHDQFEAISEEVDGFVRLAAAALDAPACTEVEGRADELQNLIAGGQASGPQAIRSAQAKWLGG